MKKNKSKYSRYKKDSTIEKAVLNKYGFGGAFGGGQNEESENKSSKTLQGFSTIGSAMGSFGAANEASKNTGYQYGTNAYFQERDKYNKMSGGVANTAAAVSPWVSAFKGIGEGIQNTVAAKDEYGVSDSGNLGVAVGGLFNPREQTTEAFSDIKKGNFDKDTALNLAAPFLGAIKKNNKNKEERAKLQASQSNKDNVISREKGMTFGLGGTHKKFNSKNPGDILEYKGDLHSDNSGGIEQKEITVEDGENEVIGEDVINSNSIKLTPSVIAMLKEQGIDVSKYEGLTPAEAVMKEVKRYNNRTSDNRFVKNALDREKANGKGRYAISNASDVLGSMLNPSTPNYQGSGDNASEGLESGKNDQIESGFENNMPEPQMNPEGAANSMAYKAGGKYNLSTKEIKELEKQGYVLQY